MTDYSCQGRSVAESLKSVLRARLIVVATVLAIFSSLVTPVGPAAAADLVQTGLWTKISNTQYSATAGLVTVTTTGPSVAAATMGSVNAYTSATITNEPSVSVVIPPAGGDITFTFSSPVNNPVLHIDRLGGTGSVGMTNSAILTITSGQTITQLSGVDHLVTTATTITRTIVAAAATSSSECSVVDSAGTACGTVRINGTGITNVSFSGAFASDPGAGDGIEFIWEIPDQDPVAVDDSVVAPYGSPVIIDALSNDTVVDGATVTAFDTASVNGGTVVHNLDGTFTYTPPLNFSGVDTFTYTLCDDDSPAACDIATVRITVPIAPAVGVAKDLVSVVDNGDGSFRATYSMVVENLGNEALVSLQVADDLSAFPPGATVGSTSSPEFTINAGFNGAGDQNLLAGTDPLAPSAVGTIAMVVDFVPVSSATINNQAVASANGAGTGTPVTDLSDDGVDPDPSGNSLPNDPGEDDPTPLDPVDIPLNPLVAATKTLDSFVDNGNGTFTAAYTVSISNGGNEALSGVQIADDLASKFPAAYAVFGPTSGSLTANGSFDGNGDQNLLAGVDTLAFGAGGTVSFSVTFTPTSVNSIDNTATASGTGVASGTSVSNGSTVGTGAIGVNSSITTTKTVGALVDNGDGTFTAPYTVSVSNGGNEALTGVQITDDLASNYPAGYTVSGPASGSLTVNAAFNGGTNQSLLTGADTLGVGATASVAFDVTFVPASGASISNTATGRGTGAASGATVTDWSTVGTGPIALAPSVAASKALVSLVDNGDGTFSANYSLHLTNDGNEALLSLQFVDDLVTGFPAGYTVSGLASPTLTVNAAFDGNADQYLLNGTDSLAVGASALLTFGVTFTPTSTNSIDNQATASGTGAVSGGPASDVTNVGTDPTDPGNPNGPTPSGPIPVAPQVLAAKNLDSIVDNGDGSFTAAYTVSINNDGNELLDSIQITDDLVTNFPAGYTVSGLTSPTLTVNVGYDGNVDQDLLTGVDSLAIGGTATVSYSVTFVLTSTASIDNQATASGTGHVSGNGASADTTVGTDPTNPGNPVGPTPTETFTVTPVVGTAKAVSSLVDNGNGSFTVTMGFVIESLGTEGLASVQLTDDLAAQFPAGFSVDSLTSPTLTVNPGFDGIGDPSVLSGGDSLALGASATVTMIVTFVPTTPTLTNQATATATGALSGVLTSDLSDAGTDPDGDGDGNPNEATENDPTPISPPLLPKAPISKTVAPLVDNRDGSFTASYTVYVANDGNEILDSVQITDDLASNYPAGYTVSGLSSATLAVNAGFNGGANQHLLTGADSLAVGASGSVSFSVTFVPSSTASLDNQATSAALGHASGISTGSPSTVGTDPTDPANPGGPTPTGPVDPSSAIGGAKNLDSLADNGDGSFTATYTFTLENLGSEPVGSVQLSDDLVSEFPGGYMVDTVSSATLTVSPTFDGFHDQNLLAGVDVLAPATTSTVTMVVTFTPDGTSIDNQGTVSGVGQLTGRVLTDLTDSGLDPDGDGDGDPSGSGEGDPTATIPALNPTVGAAKEFDSLTDNGDGSFTVAYTVTLTVFANEAVQSLRAEDNLATTFPAGFTVDSVTSADFTVNPSFNGVGDIDLLDGSDSANVGDTGTVAVTVTFVPVSLDPVANSVVVRAVGAASGISTSDLSVDGLNPDPNEDGSPTEDSPTMTPAIPLVPGIAATKTTVGAMIDNGDGTFTVNYRITITNTGNEALSPLQFVDDLAANFPAGFTVSAVASPALTVNPGFDGAADPALLGGADSLAAGGTGEVTFSVTFLPVSAGSIDNTVTVSGTGAISDTPASDGSTVGTGPIPLSPASTTDKSLAGLVDNEDGSFTASYEVRVTNIGNERLDSVAVIDNLAATYPVGFTVSGVSSPTLAANPAYDGAADPSLLAATDSLAVGETATITYSVTFVPTSSAAVANTASTSTVGGASGQPGDSASTASTGAIPLGSEVATAKRVVGAIADNGDGTFSGTFSFVVENLGNEPGGFVQITDDLSGLGTGATVNSLTSADLTVNPAFDGIANTHMLAGTDQLIVGQTGSVTLAVTWTPEAGDVTNQATTTSTGLTSGTISTDQSTDGSDPDPDGNGTGDEATPTPVLPPYTSVLEADKVVQEWKVNPDGSATIRYRIDIANRSNQPMEAIQIADDGSQLGEVISASIVSTSANLTPNPAFGASTPDLLAGSDGLGADEEGYVVVEFTVFARARMLENQATVSGSGRLDSVAVGAASNSGAVDGPTTLELTGQSIAGLVWDDTNGDGVADSGEPLLSGVTVILRPISGGSWDDGWPTDAFGNPVVPPVRTTTTDANGRYFFGPVPDGSYRVEVIVGPAWSITPISNQGPDDARDSDFDSGTYKTAVLTIVEGSFDCSSRYVCDTDNISVGLVQATLKSDPGNKPMGGDVPPVLAFTGASTTRLAFFGLLLVLMGWMMAAAGRRREKEEAAAS